MNFYKILQKFDLEIKKDQLDLINKEELVYCQKSDLWIFNLFFNKEIDLNYFLNLNYHLKQQNDISVVLKIHIKPLIILHSLDAIFKIFDHLYDLKLPINDLKIFKVISETSNAKIKLLLENQNSKSHFIKIILNKMFKFINDLFDVNLTFNLIVKKQNLSSKLVSKSLKKTNLVYRNSKFQNVTINFNDVSYDQIKNIPNKMSNIIVQGRIFKVNVRRIKNDLNRNFYFFWITDFEDSIKVKIFSLNNNNILKDVKVNDFISVYGDAMIDSYSKELVINCKALKIIDKPLFEEQDLSEDKRIELHVHSKMSVMDGVGDIEEYFKIANHFNHKAIAFTDHNNVQAFPKIFEQSKKYPNIKPIYGIEFDVFDEDPYYIWNIKNKNLENSKYVIFDIETTGLSAEYDEIIEFGAVIYENIFAQPKKVQFFIKASNPLSKFTKEFSRISDEDLVNGLNIKDAFKKIQDVVKGAILVAHNASFDWDFLQSIATKLNLDSLKNTVIDTLSIARVLIPKSKNYRLGTIAQKLLVAYDEKSAHRADYDALVLSQVYFKLFDIMKNKYQVINDQDISLIHTKENQQLLFSKKRPHHVTVLAKNQSGLKDLFKLISLSYTKHFYKTPQISYQILEKHRKNLLIGSSCYQNNVFEAAHTKQNEILNKRIDFYDYIEIQPLEVYNHLYLKNKITKDRLKTILKNIVLQAQKKNKLVVATGDVHYVKKSDQIFRTIYINSKGLGAKIHSLYDFKYPNLKSPPQYFRTTNDMLKGLDFLEDKKLITDLVIKNTQKIYNQIGNIKVIYNELHTPNIDKADQKLKTICMANAHKQYGEILPDIVWKRLEKELRAIIDNNFSVIYYVAYKLVSQSLKDGYLVGSRGSVGSSLVATMCNITEVNPLPPHYYCSKCQYSDFKNHNNVTCGFDLSAKKCPKCQSNLIGEGHNIPFETFLGLDANKVPDIDLNFSSNYQAKAHNFIRNLFGRHHTYRAGTISTVASKTAYGYVQTFLENKGLSDNTKRAEIDRLTKGCEGVKRTTGQHPGGIIIIPKQFTVEDFTPYNFPADDFSSEWFTTHFDFHAIHDNLLKLDILGHVDPTALRMLQNLTNVNPKTIPTNDQKVLSLFQNLNSLNIKSNQINNEITGAIGIPEFGTKFVRKMLIETKPNSFADLVKISGLSHGTNVWINNLQNTIKNGLAKISDVMGCRDDIMVYLINNKIHIKDAFQIMEQVRKGQGLDFDQLNILKNHNIPNWYVEACQKITYMFPKAHATAYVLMAWRVAWYKVYYPIEYYTTFFTTRTDVFDLFTILQGPKIINSCLSNLQLKSNSYFTKSKNSAKENELVVIYEVALEMLARGIKLINIDLNKSKAFDFTIQEQNGEKVILPPLSAIDGLGPAAANSIVTSRNKKPLKTLDDLKKISNISKTHISQFEELGILKDLVDSQFSFEF